MVLDQDYLHLGQVIKLFQEGGSDFPGSLIIPVTLEKHHPGRRGTSPGNCLREICQQFSRSGMIRGNISVHRAVSGERLQGNHFNIGLQQPAHQPGARLRVNNLEKDCLDVLVYQLLQVPFLLIGVVFSVQPGNVHLLLALLAALSPAGLDRNSLTAAPAGLLFLLPLLVLLSLLVLPAALTGGHRLFNNLIPVSFHVCQAHSYFNLLAGRVADRLSLGLLVLAAPG